MVFLPLVVSYFLLFRVGGGVGFGGYYPKADRAGFRTGAGAYGLVSAARRRQIFTQLPFLYLSGYHIPVYSVYNNYYMLALY